MINDFKNIDLNSLFNLTYNFDILKNLAENLIENQKNLQLQIANICKDNKEKEQKIFELESNIIKIELKNENDLDKIKELQNKHNKLKLKEVQNNNDNNNNNNNNNNNLENKINENKSNKNISNSLDNKRLTSLENSINELKSTLSKYSQTLNNFEDESYINLKINNSIEKTLSDEISNLKSEINKNLLETLNKKIDTIYSDFTKNLKPLQEKIDIFQNDLISNNNIFKNRLENFEKNNNEFKKHINNNTINIKQINEKILLFLTTNDLLNIKNELSNNFQKEFQNISNNLNSTKKNLDSLKNSFINYISDETDHNQLQNLHKKFESIMSTIYELQDVSKEMRNKLKEKPLFDPNKFINIQQFNEYKQNIIKFINDFKEKNNEINNKFNNLIDNDLKLKASLKDVKTLEDDFNVKVEDIKILFGNNFMEKKEIIKNFKYFENQIKIALENSKKLDRSESWLLSKRPMNVCASCEAYIGELKENNNYVPWNKYPLKEIVNNDNNNVNNSANKLYRVGSGFSKMLQIMNVDGKKKNNNNIDININDNNVISVKNSNVVSNSNNNYDRNLRNNLSVNQSLEKDSNNNLENYIFENNNNNEGKTLLKYQKSLPKLFGHKKKNFEEGDKENDLNPFDDYNNNNNNEEKNQQPKIMKIYKKITKE